MRPLEVVEVWGFEPQAFSLRTRNKGLRRFATDRDRLRKSRDNVLISRLLGYLENATDCDTLKQA